MEIYMNRDVVVGQKADYVGITFCSLCISCNCVELGYWDYLQSAHLAIPAISKSNLSIRSRRRFRWRVSCNRRYKAEWNGELGLVGDTPRFLISPRIPDNHLHIFTSDQFPTRLHNHVYLNISESLPSLANLHTSPPWHQFIAYCKLNFFLTHMTLFAPNKIRSIVISDV